MSAEKLKQSQIAEDDRWENISSVEFAGNMPLENTEAFVHDIKADAIQDNLAEIRTILDTRSIAESVDPNGLIEARKKDQDILESCSLQCKKLEDEVADYIRSKRNESRP